MLKEENFLELNKTRNELSINGKNGLSFLLSAIVVWSIITVIFLQSINISQKNLFMLYTTGIMFPLSIGLSTVLKVDWQFKNNPLGQLGLFLNLAQIIYFPILFWGMIKSPNDAIIFFAIITGAHFFPYGWFYKARAYFVMAPVIALIIMFAGLYLNNENLWLIPFLMVICLLCLCFWLYLDYKAKINTKKH